MEQKAEELYEDGSCGAHPRPQFSADECGDTINDNDMFSYSLTAMMCFLTKERYDFPAYTVNLFIKAYHKITYKEDLKIT